MFRIEDAKGRTIRSAVSNAIVTVINPARQLKVIPSGHIDSVTTGHSTTAQSAAQAAEDARDEAQKLAIEPTDSSFNLSDGTTGAYSALHYAGEAANSAAAAANSATSAASDAVSTAADRVGVNADRAVVANDRALAQTARTEAVQAENAAELARLAAVAAQAAAETAETGSETARDDAQDARDDAEKLAAHAEDSQFTLSDGTTTGYSAFHYQQKAADVQTDITAFNTDKASFDTDFASFETDYANFETSLTTQSTALTQAAASIYSIAGVHTNFDQRYQGDFATNPTARTGGGALQVGDLFYYTGTPEEMRVWDGSQWRSQINAIAPKTRHTYIYVVPSNSSHVFSGADLNGATLEMDNDDLVELHINGVRIRDDEFTVNTTTNTLTIDNDVTLTPGEDILITVHEHFTVASAFPAQGGTFTGTVNFGDVATFNDDATFNHDVTVAGDFTSEVVQADERVLIDATYNSVYNINVDMLQFEVNGAGVVGQLGLKRSYPDYPATNTHDRLFIESRNPASQSSVAGLQFENTVIYPRYNADIDSGNNVSLGTSGYSFDNAYVQTVYATDVYAADVQIGSQTSLTSQSSGRLDIDTQDQGVSLDGYAIKGCDLQLADDAIGSVTPPRKGGWLLFGSDSDADHPVTAESTIIFYDVGVSKRITRAIENNYVGSNFRVINASATTVPTNASDYVDGKIHLHAGNDGDIYCVNRTGSTKTFHFLFL